MTETATETMVAGASEYHPVEIGGVLVGVAVEGRPWITDAVVVPAEKQSPTYYELPRGARHSVVDAARERDGRVGYIGDWHAHPADIGPSDTDFTTIHALSGDQGANCPRPVLLIARRVGGGYQLDARQFTGRRLRRLRIVAAGTLPPVEKRLTRRSAGTRRERGVPSRRHDH